MAKSHENAFSSSDMNNSDNQTSRSQQSTPQDGNRNQISPKNHTTMNNPVGGSSSVLKRSPASHESSEFEQQFEQSMAAAAVMPHGSDEYMRQMAMGNQPSTEGKLTVSSFLSL